MQVEVSERECLLFSSPPTPASGCSFPSVPHAAFKFLPSNGRGWSLEIVSEVFVLFLRKQVTATKAEAERDGVKVPTTLAEYCVRTRAPAPDEGSDLFYDTYYDDDDMEGGDGDCCYDEDDSGNEES